jgi:hypothetical protein
MFFSLIGGLSPTQLADVFNALFGAESKAKSSTNGSHCLPVGRQANPNLLG